MRRTINKISSNILDEFLLRSNTGHIEKKVENGFSVISQELFAHIKDRKRVIVYLESLGLDAFKRGTLMPKAIRAALDEASWEAIKELDPEEAAVHSIFD